MKTFLLSLGLPLAVLALVTADNKQGGTSDTDFLVQAFTSGVAEVKLSEYAAKNAGDEKVRNYARHLVNDHKELNKALGENAGRLKVAVAAGLEKDTRDRLDTLSKLKGVELDNRYLQFMVSDHEKALKLFEAESKNGTDPDLKALARDSLPTLKKHLEGAREHWSRLKK